MLLYLNQQFFGYTQSHYQFVLWGAFAAIRFIPCASAGVSNFHLWASFGRRQSENKPTPSAHRRYRCYQRPNYHEQIFHKKSPENFQSFQLN
jgi:hypothetical protein